MVADFCALAVPILYGKLHRTKTYVEKFPINDLTQCYILISPNLLKPVIAYPLVLAVQPKQYS